MNKEIDKKFKKINMELNERTDLVELFVESWHNLSVKNEQIKEFLGIKIKEIFDLDYGEFTINIGTGEICIVMWNDPSNDDVEKLDKILGKKSKVIHKDDFYYIQYEFMESY